MTNAVRYRTQHQFPMAIHEHASTSLAVIVKPVVDDAGFDTAQFMVAEELGVHTIVKHTFGKAVGNVTDWGDEPPADRPHCMINPDGNF